MRRRKDTMFGVIRHIGRFRMSSRTYTEHNEEKEIHYVQSHVTTWRLRWSSRPPMWYLRDLKARNNNRWILREYLKGN